MRLPEFLTTFVVPKQAVIQNHWLRIPEFLIFITTFMFFFVYTWLYDLGFATIEPLRGQTWMKVSAPQTNFWTCRTSVDTKDLACDYVKHNVSELPYCEQSGKSTTPCMFLTPLDLLPPEGSFIGTAVSMMTYPDVTLPAASVHNYYVAGIHSFMIRVRSRFFADLVPISYTIDQLQGYLEFKEDGSLRSIPKVKAPGQAGQEESIGHRKESIGTLCGTSDPTIASGDVCMDTMFSDYYSIGTLLRAANLTLTDEMRTFGFTLLVKFEFDNLRNFWTHPFGFKPEYIVKVSPAEFSHGGGLSEEYFDRHQYSEDWRSKSTIRVRGIRFVFESTGRCGIFILGTALSRLAVASVFLTMGKLMTTEVLSRVYGMTPALQHVHLQHMTAEYEVESPETLRRRMLHLKPHDEETSRSGFSDSE